MVKLQELDLLYANRRARIDNSDSNEHFIGRLVIDPLYVGKLAFLIDGDEMPNVIDINDSDEIELIY